ncbi:MAG TPA: tRNA 2-thiouridine(34) synthase MnmA [Actinomycetota bacterium]|nr:tRNA 2-thiouridine(34) synthase MnmA [Actinomycetota bacterium]
MSKKKAVVAMSGGVDSSVAAALLVEDGYDVTGIMLKLWKGEDQNNNSGCCSLGAAEDARRVADVLGIPFYVFNFAERFEETVVADFNATYAAGRTPNPCVRCNQWIKFDALLARAKSLGADVLATGHYARIDDENGIYRLLRGVDPAKDQSYVLWMLTQAQLQHTRFPVGAMPKSETRAIAAELGLRIAAKPDSQEICFVRNGDVGAYLDEHVPERPGEIVDRSGAKVGTHRGVARYTVGQRKGLGISLGVPVFVTSLDVEANRVVIGDRDDLLVSSVTLDDVSSVGAPPEPGAEVVAQYRAHGETVAATVAATGEGTWKVRIDPPVAAVAPGQSMALYRAVAPHDLIGGGIIAATSRDRVAA